ncbi:mitochondrial 54S ribosomal protein bL21m KNAG_0B01770 [Huiozyma naganishii CBS 8797]|uniref:Large ribosomal subunit protein bL21m n=1 Tax=Huiozyma naganishii (strain ATCC MYA-139 / BCRC 22969 / CBS 8797 / KCTC 17520 / NBRC 10181 / NCYC 3082 / Yp74L-3) TaxID=1071383 RepID=J7R1D8_HUIN7|nr:hypothetical protein KNAG_0B01770 [Kazachstania naganishii CBS 8797]CCK68620.1 hypothetical protein KNAG_0B01770 [Kazachstania naganishii CBS 8797]
MGQGERFSTSVGIAISRRWNSSSLGRNEEISKPVGTSLTDTTSTDMDTTPLKLSNELYAMFRIHNRPYTVTVGDTVILPFKMKDANLGDTLCLTDVARIGSRNYTLAGGPIDQSLYTLKATVIEKTKRKFETREITKRRHRRVRTVAKKGDLTLLRINELTVH